MAVAYDVQEVERRWQERWAADGTYEIDNDDPRPPAYVLCMYPYPSGPAHQGHVRNYTFGDLLVRYRTMRGHGSADPVRVRQLRPERRERRDQDRHSSSAVHRRPDRGAEGVGPAARRLLRLAPDAPQPRPVLHPVVAVDLPAAAGGGPGLPGQRARELVPGLPDGAGERAGPERRHVRAVGRPCHQAGPGAVVLQDHRLRPATAGRPGRPGLAGTGRDDAAQLDRPVRGRRVHDVDLRRRRLDRSRRAVVHRVHDAAGHELRHDVRGAGARASAGPGRHRAGPPRGRRAVRRAGPQPQRDRPPVERRVAGEARCLHRRLRA